MSHGSEGVKRPHLIRALEALFGQALLRARACLRVATTNLKLVAEPRTGPAADLLRD